MAKSGQKAAPKMVESCQRQYPTLCVQRTVGNLCPSSWGGVVVGHRVVMKKVSKNQQYLTKSPSEVSSISLLSRFFTQKTRGKKVLPMKMKNWGGGVMRQGGKEPHSFQGTNFRGFADAWAMLTTLEKPGIPSKCGVIFYLPPNPPLFCNTPHRQCVW